MFRGAAAISKLSGQFIGDYGGYSYSTGRNETIKTVEGVLAGEGEIYASSCV